MIQTLRGEIWLVDLNPTNGHEQSGQRPGLVISDDIFNTGPAELVVILPLTSKNKKIPLHEKIIPPEGGLKEVSYVKCEDIRSVSKQRLLAKIGRVSNLSMNAVETKIKILLRFL
ncbi:mRNA interferase MazF [Desulfonatronum thiosulfatophilum]|uniref:mRNA interferase n=1 Tax=Desulfonatronum thiosulfatophilum TaxID=617002 RepID=A0A1G6DIW9_9BACT|nr:type II toxin-antitoxin system PemK/MazF family toxin [Desulfonatronum thiosulfatophilum]SDB45093.1 mRNA interferase MazF [Desulfonatronum thiosulfatophilum]